VEAAPHIHPHMLVRVGHNLAEEDNLDKTAGGSRGSDGVQRHWIPAQGSKTWR
jgi:hypothetical protein